MREQTDDEVDAYFDSQNPLVRLQDTLVAIRTIVGEAGLTKAAVKTTEAIDLSREVYAMVEAWKSLAPPPGPTSTCPKGKGHIYNAAGFCQWCGAEHGQILAQEKISRLRSERDDIQRRLEQATIRAAKAEVAMSTASSLLHASFRKPAKEVNAAAAEARRVLERAMKGEAP